AFSGKNAAGCNPNGVLMHTIRRGVLATGAPTERVSSRGSASEMPAARRKVRRVRFIGKASFLVAHWGASSTSFRLKHPALHNLMDQRAESVVLLAIFFRDRLDLGFVRRFRGGAGGVG